MRVRRTAWQDSRREPLSEGEASRVFVGGQEIKVSPIATLIVDQLDLDSWTEVRDVVRVVEQTYGPPPHTSTATAVRHTVRELERAGVVEIEADEGELTG